MDCQVQGQKTQGHSAGLIWCYSYAQGSREHPNVPEGKEDSSDDSKRIQRGEKTVVNVASFNRIAVPVWVVAEDGGFGELLPESEAPAEPGMDGKVVVDKGAPNLAAKIVGRSGVSDHFRIPLAWDEYEAPLN